MSEQCLSSANIQEGGCRSKFGGELEGSGRADFLTVLVSCVRSEVGELGGLYAPRQAPSGGIGGLRWCFFHPARDPRQTPKTTVKPHQGGMKRPALVLFPPRRASWADPTAARYTHGGTVHPWRHGTPMAARYTHGGTAHTTAARHTPRRRRTGKAVAPGGRAPALLRYPLKACCFAPFRAPTMQGAQRSELEWIKACCCAPSRAPTTQGAQSSASWKA